MLRKLYRRSLRIVIDSTIVAVSLSLACLIRFEGSVPVVMFWQALLALPYMIAARLSSSGAWGVYRVSWRFVSVRDVWRFGIAAILPSLLFLALRLGLPHSFDYLKLPISIIAIEGILSFLGTLGIRVAWRWFAELTPRLGALQAANRKPVLLIGAGRAGFIICKEITSRQHLGLLPVGFIDDDPAKRGQTVHGVRVLGGIGQLSSLVKRFSVDRVIITIASASRAQMKTIIEACEAVPVRAQIIPGIYELVDGSVSVSRLRDVQVEDLLGREPVSLDMAAIRQFLVGRAIMVTGAGGSIGSEMCRQVCRFGPASLILVERTESNLFHIDRELRASYPDLDIRPFVADITDADRMEQVFLESEPRIVIHAAAYKHVPLMEGNVGEAVKNNVFGTRMVADLAHRHGSDAFVMISTDKAVNPTSVMGSTKRVAEMYVQSLSQISRTRFLTVRFGNVLGSVGSVVPIFKEQIARGGPVTVTDPDMQRYFMTIPEASQLVLEAASMGRSGEIYVLDMGQPIKIVTVAEQLIRLSGLKPYEDIEIVFTGIRPGEKLFEEISLDDEKVSKTKHEKIYVGNFRPLSPDLIEKSLRELNRLLRKGDPETQRAALAELVSRDRGVGADSIPAMAGAHSIEGNARLLRS